MVLYKRVRNSSIPPSPRIFSILIQRLSAVRKTHGILSYLQPFDKLDEFIHLEGFAEQSIDIRIENILR